MRNWIVLAALALVPAAVTGGALASGALASGTSEPPPNWHVHDGQLALGPQHKGIGFFPAILGVSSATYLQDPASCPDATDKAFLPQGRQPDQPLRAGVCMTSSSVIQLHTVEAGTKGPEGWASITAASEPGWVTYYRVTAR
jgi:hypothetical protein